MLNLKTATPTAGEKSQKKMLPSYRYREADAIVWHRASAMS